MVRERTQGVSSAPIQLEARPTNVHIFAISGGCDYHVMVVVLQRYHVGGSGSVLMHLWRFGGRCGASLMLSSSSPSVVPAGTLMVPQWSRCMCYRAPLGVGIRNVFVICKIKILLYQSLLCLRLNRPPHLFYELPRSGSLRHLPSTEQ